MTIEREISKYHLRYYIGKHIYVEWDRKAFMKEYISLYKVISESEFIDISNNIKYDVSNCLIQKIFLVQEGLRVLH